MTTQDDMTKFIDDRAKYIKKLENHICENESVLIEQEVESLKWKAMNIIEEFAELSDKELSEYNYNYLDAMKEKAWRIHDYLRGDTEYEVHNVRSFFSKVNFN